MGAPRTHAVGPIDWATLMQKHYRATCGVIARLMPRSLRRMYDPEDFVIDAIVELMAKPDQLVEKGPSLLTLVARRRMIDAARSPRSRLMPLEVDIIDPQPSALLENEANELRELMLRRARDPRELSIVELRCRGHTLPEIAELTGLGVRQLQRFWKHFTEANEPY
jgi:RNA polymerase sigma factor (sigma-70 family)